MAYRTENFNPSESLTQDEVIFLQDLYSNAVGNPDKVIINPMTAGGDIIYGGASGTPTRLANGSAGQVLTSAGGTDAPTWETPSPAVSFGADNQIPYTNATTDDFDYSSNFTFNGSALAVQGSAVFNEAGADVDFRIEGDTDNNLFFLDASTDRIGIGQGTPLAKLHVSSGGILASGTTGSTPTSGAGTRLMWIPAKSALRAGIITTGTNWDDANIGTSSVAMGNNTKASGTYSVATGQGSIASGFGAWAHGIADAGGNTAEATNTSAMAFGTGSIASGLRSIAIASTSGTAAPRPTASSEGSTIIGSSVNSGINSSGTFSSTGTGSILIGRLSISGFFTSSSMRATGEGSIGIGYTNGSSASTLLSSGKGSVVLGLANSGTHQATGQGAVVIGQNLQATQNNAIAIGSGITNNTASSFDVGFTTRGFRVQETAITIGSGKAGTDYTLTFDGETNDGLITWMEDEDYFDFADDVKLSNRFTCNTATLSTTGPTDNYDVADINVLFIDASSNSVTVGGFVNGRAGQILHVVVTGINAGNSATLEHNEATGNQDIFLTTGNDETLTNSYGGWTLVCDGTNWYSSEQ